MDIPTMEGITAHTLTTARLTTRVLTSGDDSGIPVIFIHGNVSNATYWEEVMVTLPDGYRGIAADNRGYGGADPAALIDATRGMGDLSDDVAALMDTLGIEKAHVVGHSLGASVVWRFMTDYPQRILSVTVVAAGSPFGFGACKGDDGELCFSDGAGSGAGIAGPEFVKLLKEGDRSSDHQNSPRNVMLNFYFKPPFKPAREEALLSAMLDIHLHDKGYPGDAVPSQNWPGVAPGKFGPNNAISPLYNREGVAKLYEIDPKPAVLWVRGADDQIVSDNSFFELGTLGKLGAVPGYPGEDVFPPQPMIGQTRAVLEKYQAAGGSYQEVVLADAGHTPYLEKLGEFNAAFHAHLGAR